jgi:hypothetical protein
VPKRGINGWTEKMHIYFILVGQHGIARDFYYQLSLLLALYFLLSLSLSLSISLSFCLYLSLSLSFSPLLALPLFQDKKFPALDLSFATSHLYIRR